MPNVKFNLDKPSLSETYILLKFSYNGKRLRYSTGKRISPKFWSTENQRAKQSKKLFPQYPEFNAYLSKLESDTQKIYNRFLLEDKIPSIQEFKKELDFATLKKEKEQKKNLFSFIDSFIEEREKSADFTKGTVTTYKQVRKIFKSYVQWSKNQNLDFEDIDFEFYEEFKNYLYNERKFSINYVGKIIKILKTFLSDATDKGINTNLKFQKRNFKKPKQQTDNIYLTISELTQVYNYDFSKNERLEKVRDLFMIGCFTGLRFSDFTNINPENITTICDEKGNPNEVIKITPQKPGKKGEPVFIPIHNIVKSILQKYENNLPQALSNQKMNDYLKDVAKLSGLTESIQLSKSIAGKRIDRTYEKWEKVTTHTARRSFATNAFKSGIQAISIMRITGHKTESAFMEYIKISNEENAVLMAQNNFFKISSLKIA